MVYLLSAIYLYLSIGVFVLIVFLFRALKRRIIALINQVLANPYKYPYCYIDIDVSRKSNLDTRDLAESHMLETGSIYVFRQHHEKVQLWKQITKSEVDKSLLRKRRLSQYLETVDDANEFVFRFNRTQTRYRQVNNVKYPYTANVVSDTYGCSYEDVEAMYDSLKSIGFETTVERYFRKNQRSLMTRDLRRKIIIRDNYTCQICGKRMPDLVGLQIDHIVPVSKGGRTVPSNLQVLCSVCNQRKSNKLDY